MFKHHTCGGGTAFEFLGMSLKAPYGWVSLLGGDVVGGGMLCSYDTKQNRGQDLREVILQPQMGFTF